MDQARGHKKRLSIIPPVFAPNDNINKSPNPNKTPNNNFQGSNGGVGLGIVAAMSDNQVGNNASILLVSPRLTSNPIPILRQKQLSIEEMEMCEEYTRVISHQGGNLVKKTEYFDDRFIGNGYHRTVNFLDACSFCRKQLRGMDIFMSGGDMAFCSSECRCKQMSIDDHKDKCGSAPMKSSEAPCSGPMQFSAGVAVA